MKNANVQNHPCFTIDFKDFTVATKSENHRKYWKNDVNVHVVTTSKKHQKNHLKKAPKWLQNQLKIDVGSHPRACPIILSSLNHSKSIFLMIFINFSSKMDPKMDQKINQKSTPSPPGLLEGPPDGPRSLRDPILD